ncbi:protein timeless homolog [Argonauta hians]
MDIELQAICSTLGYQEGSKYLKEPDCLESIKDLIRCLRRDDETCSIRRQLGQAEILQSDLLPLLKEYKSDGTLFETVIRLLLNITQPARLCFSNQLPEDKVQRNHYLEVESILRGYKKAFIDDVLFAVLTEKLTDLLKLDWEHRHEEDRMLIERLLILVRNVLHVQPDANEEKRTDDDASIHDQVLWSLHVSGMEDLLLYIANSADERQYCMHTLEIVSLIFRQQTPVMLASAGVQRAISEKEKDVRELEIIREQEQIAKRERVRTTSSRHSRFGGTFVLKNMKSITDRDVIYHRSVDKASQYSFDINKKSSKTPKNRAPIKHVDVVRRSTLSIRLCLKEFCVQFLENCYNPLMSAVKDNLVREVTQDHDETYYLWSLTFFMEFCRLHNRQVELVSETLSVSTFHYIQVNLLNYYEMIMTDKKEAKIWAKRVHLALKAYQELLMTLHSMETSKNPHLVSSVKVLKGNIFYMMEFRDIFIMLLTKFNHSRNSTSYLTDLVHATHLFLKMLELTQKSNRCLVVQTKKKKPKKTKKKKSANSLKIQSSEEELLSVWDDISSEVSDVLGGLREMREGVMPFDAASEVDIDQQRADTMMRIQTCLRSKNAAEGVALLRAAREVWPDNNEFGTAEMSSEEEFLALREIFMAELSQNIQIPETVQEEEEQDEVMDEEMSAVAVSEEELNTRDFIAKFAKPTILQSYTTLLANFKKNSTHTNHCIIKMFHRIAVDLHQEGMFFQASLFCIFREAFALSKVKHFREIVKFGEYITQKFLAVAEKNKKVFMEMLFWKTAREAGEISDGYFDPNKNIKEVWTEDQEIELKRLFEEAKEDPEIDIIGHIMTHLTDETKSRRQVLRQLRISGLIESARDLKRRNPISDNRIPWTEEQEIELRNVFEQFRNSDDPLGNVMKSLSFTKSKNKIKDKLFGLDIIQDKKELYKKRSRKERHDESGASDSNDNDVDDNNSGNDDDVNVNDSGNDDGVDVNDSSNDDGSSFTGNPVMAAHTDSSEQESDGETEEPCVTEDLPNSDIDEVLKRLVEHNYKRPLSWIQRSLRRTAEDRQTPGNYVGVPLVPLTEENEDAMEDPIFLEFLSIIGLSRPIVGQETFWRITGNLDGATLKLIADSINLDENDQAVDTAQLKNWLASRSAKSNMTKRKKKSKKQCKTKPSGNNNKRKQALMALQKKQAKSKANVSNKDKDAGGKKTGTKKRRQNKKKEAFEGESDDDNQNVSVSQNKMKYSKEKKKKIFQFDSSDDDNDDDNQNNMSISQSPATKSLNKDTDSNKKKIIQFDSSDDDDNQNNMSISQSPAMKSQNKDVDSKKKNIIQFDSSDDDDDVPLTSLSLSNKETDHNVTGSNSKRRGIKSVVTDSSDSDSDGGRLVIETETLKKSDEISTADNKRKRKRLLRDSDDGSVDNNDNVDAMDIQQEDTSECVDATVEKDSVTQNASFAKSRKRPKVLDSESDDDDNGRGDEDIRKSPKTIEISPQKKPGNRSKKQKALVLESSDESSSEDDKENRQIDSKQDATDVFDIAKSIEPCKYKQHDNSFTNPTDTFPATLMSLPNAGTDSNVFDDHVPLVTAIRKKRVLDSDEDEDD